MNKIWIAAAFAVFISSCQPQPQEQAGKAPQENAQQDTTAHTVPTPDIENMEQSLIDNGLLNLQTVDSTIIVNLRYSGTDNFVGTDVYGDLQHAYMQPEPAHMLVQANAILKATHPDYTLYIYDAVRPRRVQQILWDMLDHPVEERVRYVADPQKGSIHNYGCAVDLTIADAEGNPLDMGTDFDYFGVLAYPVKEDEMLETGKLAQQQVDNRHLLRKVMTEAGFASITSEWWHFNAMTLSEASKAYQIVE